ncbi:MAG: PAS domain S-box protein, partial [Gemmataceae bacterium]|nr:PAS domain S-box protein [Gemmataceae bacterium]
MMAAIDVEGDRPGAEPPRQAEAVRQAERDLAAERERLRATLASIGDAVVSTDAAGRVTFLNGVAEALTGWTQADAAGRPLPEIFHIVNEHTRQPVENPALRALRDGVVDGLANHTVLIARDGTERPIDDSAAPVRDDAGTPVGSVLVFRDVTERKRAEEARARLAAIVESSDDAIVSKTLDGVIRSWNAGAERVFGWTAAEAVGRSITLIIPPERLDEERDILARLRRGERVDHFETARVAKDGRLLDISLTVSPVRDAAGRVVGASKVARDITDRRRAEDARRFLAEAGEVLGSSLDYEATLADVARLVVPRLADWCSVYVAEPDGRLRQLAVAHADPAKVAWARDLAARYPPDPDDPHGVPAVIRSGEPRLAPELTDEMVASAARDPDHLAALRALGLRSVMVVPLTARDRTLGAITFVAAESGRRYADADLALAVDLGRRAGLAVDNARLFRESQEALRLLGLLVEASGRLTGSLDPPAVGAAILDLSHRLVEADAYALWRLSPGGTEWAVSESAGLSDQYLRTEGHISAVGHAIPDRPIVAEDARAAARLESRRRAYEAEGIVSLLAVPLRTHGRVTGTLVFYYRRRRRFDDATVRVASALADLAGAAVGTAELYARESASRRRAEEADRQKGEFLAMLAHELRNPLAPLKNSLHILRLRGDDPAVAGKAREVMDRQVSHLGRLVDDLLDVTRVSTGKVRLRAERLDLGGVARQAAADHRAAYDAKGVSLAVRAPDRPVWVSGDPTRLAQIADNLLTNARKFTPAGGAVEVCVGEDGGRATLAVRDSGAGVDPAMLGRLFEPFAQADRTLDRTAGGLGLGLAIVKGLAALHGGTVRAESAGLGRGATFTVTLPAVEDRP